MDPASTDFPSEWDWQCLSCHFIWVAEIDNSNGPCPACGDISSLILIADKLRTIGGAVSTEGDWVNGKAVLQLHPDHPDRMVTSQKQAEKVYCDNGLDPDTGLIIDEPLFERQNKRARKGAHRRNSAHSPSRRKAQGKSALPRTPEIQLTND